MAEDARTTSLASATSATPQKSWMATLRGLGSTSTSTAPSTAPSTRTAGVTGDDQVRDDSNGHTDASAASRSTAAAATMTSSAAPDTAPAKAKRFLVNDPQRTGYDPTLKWWMNYFKILKGDVTPEGVHHYREDRYRAREEQDCKRCEQYRDKLFATSPMIRFLNQKIEALGGRLDGNNVVCQRCPTRIDDEGNVYRSTGGFSPQHGIMICANEISSKTHLEDTLAHEMVHAWDHLRWRLDWAGELSLRHAACTEIRASMLSGECRWTNESLKGGNWTITQQFQECVRRRAVQSVMARPTCKDDVQAVRAVNGVWDSCFNDKRPFDEIYR